MASKANFTKKLVGTEYQYLEDKNGSIPAIVWTDGGKNKYRAMIVHMDFSIQEQTYKVKIIKSIKPNGEEKWNDIDGYDLVNDKNNYRHQKSGKLIPTEKAIIQSKDKKSKKVTTTIANGVITGGEFFTKNLSTKSESLFELVFDEVSEKEGL